MTGTCRDDGRNDDERRVTIRFGRPFGSLFGRGAFEGFFGGSMFDELTDIDRRFEMMRREMDNAMGPATDACGCGEGDGHREGGGEHRRMGGPRVYGYRMSVGPDGVPHVKEWGNYRPSWAPQEDGVKDRGPGLPPPEPMEEEGVCRPTTSGTSPGGETPMYEIGDCGDFVSLVAELPGVDRKDIDVRMDDGVLRMDARGRHKSFTLTVPIPGRVRLDRRLMNCRNGMLELRLRKLPQEEAPAEEPSGDACTLEDHAACEHPAGGEEDGKEDPSPAEEPPRAHPVDDDGEGGGDGEGGSSGGPKNIKVN